MRVGEEEERVEGWGLLGWEIGVGVVITDLRHLRAMKVSLRRCLGSIGLLHRVAVFRDRLSRLGRLVAPKVVVSSCAWER